MDKPEQTKQEELPEAASSSTYSLIDKNGFNILFTVRDTSGTALLNIMPEISNRLLKDGYKPQAPKGFFPKVVKPVVTVPGRVCPTCKAPLVYFEAKGRKHIKCSTAKYDWKTKQSLGCSFVEWAKDESQEKITSFDQEYS